MNAWGWINLILGILTGVAGQLKSSPAQAGNLKILGELQAAVDALHRVVDSEVTRDQLEAMRYTPKW